MRLATRWLPEGDAKAVAATDEPEREKVFYAAWTRYEARAKCTGAGLAGPRPGPEIVARQLEIDPGYAAAVAIDTGATGAVVGATVAADPAAAPNDPGASPPFVRRLEFSE